MQAGNENAPTGAAMSAGTEKAPAKSTSQSQKTPLAETSANTPAKTSRKRKSDVLDEPTPVVEIDDDDPRLQQITDNCNQVRKKIRNFIESGAMKVGEFQKAIGVSSNAYGRFMGQNGPHKGEGCATYEEAFVFFKKRELQGLPLTAKKPAAKKTKESKAEAEKLMDVSGVTLDGEDAGNMPVYDTCDEVRRKIRAFLKKDEVTQAAFLRALKTSFPDGRTVQGKSLNDFLNKRGAIAGATSMVYYGAYVLFEKLRVKEGKAKTKTREEMEKVWGKEGGG